MPVPFSASEAFNNACQAGHITARGIMKDDPKTFKTLKLIPEDISSEYRPLVIANAPVEYTDSGKTYRLVTKFADNSASVETAVVAHSEEDIYDYLDQGFFLMSIPHKNKLKKDETLHVVANAYDIHTAHVFAMCKLQPELTSFLKNSCFINVYDAEMIRLRMNKKLSEANKLKYSPISALIDSDYKKNTTLLVLGKLLNNEIEKTTIQNITLSKTSATYEQVHIVSPGLLSLLYNMLNFNGEFDIYTIANILAASLQRDVDSEADRVSHARVDEQVIGTLPEVSINGIPISVSVSDTGQRYINKVRINKDEIAQAIYRASCHHDEKEYKLFLKSISRMSLKYHDIIANGLKVKIHNMTSNELRESTPGNGAPAIKFRIDSEDKRVKLEISDNRLVRVNLGRLIQRVDTINKKTDGRWYSRHNAAGVYRTGYRNATWAAEEVVDALLSCTTFEVERVAEDGTKTNHKETLITKQDIVALLEVVNKVKNEAIERSKQFLQTAVDLTKAERVDFMGKPAYKVTGALRTYAVVIENAKVYDFDTKQYRCIVNDRHYEGAGYDDVATRLLALKNDSVMQESISTLKGVAQPQYENAHNYTPDRDNTVNLENIVDNVLAR